MKPDKNAPKTGHPGQIYLEVRIDEEGSVAFSNLSRNNAGLVEMICGKKQKNRDFYCG